MKKKILALVLVLVVIGGLVFAYSKFVLPKKAVVEKPSFKIGFSLGSTKEDRWLTDLKIFTEKAESLGASVIATKTNDAVEQASQIEDLISQGVKVIVVVPADSTQLATAVNDAKKAGVKIVAYDRLINDSNIDYYVSFDNVEVGRLEAQSIVNVVGKGKFAYIGGSPIDNNALLVKKGSMEVLQPLIDKGDITLVLNKFSENWDSAVAFKNMKAYLATGETVDAVVAANDGTAQGVIGALHEKKLDGKVPVSGQDAELLACQRIIAGTQTSTVYKPLAQEAREAAAVAVALVQGKKPVTNGTVDNGFTDVPSFLLAPTLVTKANMMDTVIKDGFHTYDEVYK